MEIQHSVPQELIDARYGDETDTIPCDKCDKDIVLEDGFYYCSIDD